MKALVRRITSLTSLFGRGLWFLTGGQVIQLAGDHFLTVALSAFTYASTGSAWAFALGQLVLFLPWMLFSSVAGQLVDRVDCRRVMIIGDLLRGLVCLGYPFTRSLDAILVLNFIRSTGGVFANTARAALIPRLSRRERLLQVNGIRAAVFGIIDMTGPTIAGAFIARIGTTAAFRLTGIAAVIGVLCFIGIPAVAGRASDQETARASSAPPPPAAPAPGRRYRRDLGEALAFLRADRVLLGTVLLYCVYTAGQNSTNALFYPYLDSILKAGPAVFGLSISFYYGANFLGGAILAKWGRTVDRWPMALLMVPVTLIWFSYSILRHVPSVLALGFVEGLVVSVLSTLLLTRIQTRSPAGMTGRVWGLASTMTSGSEVAGILIAGGLAGSRGVQTAYRFVGLAGLVLVLGVDRIIRMTGRRRASPVGR